MVKRTIFTSLLVGVCFLISAKSEIDGYPASNFAVTANASQNGDLYGRILQNTGTLGDWLNDRGAIPFALEKDGQRQPFSAAFKQKTVRRTFPFVRSDYAKSPLVGASMHLETFCPLAVNDAETSALPSLMLELTFNSAKAENFHIVATLPDNLKDEELRLAANVAVERKGADCVIPVSLEAQKTFVLRITLAFYDRTWVSANRFRNIGELSDFVQSEWGILRDKTLAFEAAIPRTGDDELDQYLRWYMIPGIALTKYTRHNEILTMGYCELNQRDSYWSSWLHLVLFKDAEQRMIDESVEWQQPSGKIPTTILPLIERKDDIDINAFFILRASRYYRYYHDRQTLRRWWPALKNAMEWLISRDTFGDGLPAQVSFWGDWKDVKGVQGRRYSPFSAGVYLAALQQMSALSKELNDDAGAKRYGDAYTKGYDFMNKPTGQGGLWNGRYYCQRWNDGSVNTHLLQDQAIGIFYGVIPEERATSVFEELNKQSLTTYGIAETTPYYPAEWGYEPATYHNGAVWPWLSFMDCWARIRSGRTAEAISLVKRVAKADLVDSGDWSPNEHINSLTGKNLGFQLQGWNAGLFGLVYFGLLHPGIVP